MTGASPFADRRASGFWLAAIVLLLALRLPSLVQPAGGDQGLYGYSGQRILAGGVMYRDMWDQKPPALAFVYAGLWRLHRTQAVVPAADLVAAAGVAWALVVLGRRRYSSNIGFGAAAIFLLLGDPYLQRLSGIYVRTGGTVHRPRDCGKPGDARKSGSATVPPLSVPAWVSRSPSG